LNFHQILIKKKFEIYDAGIEVNEMAGIILKFSYHNWVEWKYDLKIFDEYNEKYYLIYTFVMIMKNRLDMKSANMILYWF
jgi:hypothetical protein